MAISGGDGSIILTTKVDETGLKKGFASISSFVAKAGKSFAVIGAAAATATVAITKMAVSAYADYEQLVGGVETLFKDSAGKVLEYANQAFQTAGVSANEYMQQVTSFSASLLSSLSGDTDKAADIANMALIDISDNVNKMGSSMESVTLAYQGFAKQQYMLLDNLKLGYGGTKTEMERLLKDAQALTGVKYDINNLADVYSAIHAIQEQLGITGTTMKEAETTITGSLGMVKASWQNLLTAMSGGGDLDRAINNFVYSLEKFTANIAPVIERTLLGLGQAIQRTLPLLVQTVVSALVQQIPNLVMAVYNMIMGLFNGIVLGIKALFTGGTAKATKVIKRNIGGISSGGISSGGSGVSSGGSGSGKKGSGGGSSGKKGKSAEEEQIDAEIKAIQDKIKALQKENKQISKNDKANQKANKKQLASFDDITTLNSNQISEADAMIDKNNEEIDQLQEQLDLLREKKQALQDVASAGGAGGAGAGETPEVSMPTISAGGGGGLLQDMGGIKQEIDAQLQAIMGVAGGALLAIGLLLLFSGHVIWGISFIIAGAVTVGVALQTLSQQDVVNPINAKLMTILAIAGTALTAIGLILLFNGVWNWGIAFIVAGASALGVAIVATKSGKVDTEAAKMLINIMTIAGAAMLALGVILLCFGVVSPLSIGLVVAGAASLAGGIALNPQYVLTSIQNFLSNNAGLIVGVSLALLVLGIILVCVGVVTPLSIGLIVVGATGLVTEIVLNWDLITTSVSNFLSNNAGLIVGVSLALLVLGIILCCTGVALPLGIGLIVVGAVGLATEVALNWDTIKEKTKTAFNAVINWVKTWGLLVLGIILTISGVAMPLGIALMKEGGANLTEAQDPLWTAIVDKVKEIWENIKQFWNDNIAPVFTAEWWKTLGKNCINGLIAGFEGGINGIIGAFEKMINWIVKGINSISFDLPDIMGGGHIGFNLSKVKFGRISIPRLAQGAVIPPNREFLAVLGDQKQGTNIEAPLQTIVDAFNIALQGNTNYGGGNTEVVLEIDGREFGRAVVEQGNRENRRIGTRLVTV